MSINKKRIFPFFAGILLAANIGYAAPSNAGKRVCAFFALCAEFDKFRKSAVLY